MCRLLLFAGSCTRCGKAQTWHHLSQSLSCLEAKNKGAFGECQGGVFDEHHEFDQECDRCTDEDEGIGDLGDGYYTLAQGSCAAGEEPSPALKKQKT